MSMTADDLQRLASILRWVGFSVTVIGLLITCGSYIVADNLLRVQKSDKTLAQNRLKSTEEELEKTKTKTAQLEHRLAPRDLKIEQRNKFIEHLKPFAKGPIGIVHSGLIPETIKFAEEVRSMMEGAGFTISVYENAMGYIIKEVKEPWFVAVIVGEGKQSEYLVPIIDGLKEIGIDAIPTDGRLIAEPSQIKIYIGSK